MRGRLITLITILCFVGTATAQDIPAPTVVNTNDFRGRVEGSFEFEPIKDLSFEAGVQLRLNNDLGSVDRIHTSLGVEYEACKYFSLGADYILINGYDGAASAWERPRHRLNVNFTGSVKLGRVELSLRERIQTTFRTDSVNRYEKSKSAAILRSRLMAEYSIRHSKWTPYLLFELHNTLNAPQVVANYKSDPFATDNYITRYRAGVGAKYRISRNHRMEFYYYFDYDRSYNIDYKGNKGDLKGYLQENEFRHIFGISYKFKL
jgi:hypothetical protein